MSTLSDWQQLAIHSHYQTANAILDRLQAGSPSEASQGLEVLIEAMGRSEKRAIQSQLIRLMSHIIKWNEQPELRSASWSITIQSARDEIEDIQEEVPSLNRDFIESIWEKCFQRAVRYAESEMGIQGQVSSLSWEQVFETEYRFVKPT
ncbi:DUF29 domain-containing protein [Roseofilum sp. BLCC_M91]|uniref:DUF29 domain-containing protein n=1 Tax=Roseofilum halophilum BLCC-M91 TaxID=3022259 RepID=A0ABT7BED2_9CYAN|nr:DUF29 domain-containing protein [Roseofilum halophilum]MDJ1177540.1 DUF29 domain-containing protein [Roseofilum halophilum BLCC-M91]